MANGPPQPLYDDADLYDALRVQEGGLAFYRRLATEQAGPILELGCGTGRLTLGLSPLGYPITGLDRSLTMLAAAERKSLALPVAHRPTFRQGDLVGFAEPGPFALIMIPFNTLHHLQTTDDMLSCLASVREHLAPGGVLGFDVLNPRPELLCEHEAGPYPVDRFLHPRTGLQIEEWEQLRYDRGTQVCEVILTFQEVDGEGKLLTERTLTQHLRLFFPQELDFLLRQSGWRIRDKWNDFTGQPFDGSGHKQILVCSPS